MGKPENRVRSRAARREAPVAESNRSWVRARATVLVGELRGFSSLMRRIDSDVSVRLLQEFFETAADVAVAHRAAVERVVGDSFVLLFESSATRREDGARAVRTGLVLQRSFLALRNRWERDGLLLDARLALATGVSSGPLVLAELDGVPGVHSVRFGEPLSRATQLCHGARASEVLLDDETYTACRRSLEREVVFTSRDTGGRTREAVTAYRAQLRKAGLRVVSRRLVSDPVCGTELTLRASTESREFGGAVFHFCSAKCAQRFFDDPPSWID